MPRRVFGKKNRKKKQTRPYQMKPQIVVVWHGRMFAVAIGLQPQALWM